MFDFKTGDLIAKNHPTQNKAIQIGIVVGHDLSSFMIQWTSYNKDFFMEKQEDIFKELNNSLLLGLTKVQRSNRYLNLSLLNSNYRDGRTYRGRKAT